MARSSIRPGGAFRRSCVSIFDRSEQDRLPRWRADTRSKCGTSGLASPETQNLSAPREHLLLLTSPLPASVMCQMLCSTRCAGRADRAPGQKHGDCHEPAYRDGKEYEGHPDHLAEHRQQRCGKGDEIAHRQPDDEIDQPATLRIPPKVDFDRFEIDRFTLLLRAPSDLGQACQQEHKAGKTSVGRRSITAQPEIDRQAGHKSQICRCIDQAIEPGTCG